MKNIIIDVANNTVEEKELTEAELTKYEAEKIEDKERMEAEETARVERANLKASAKAKLVAGEPITEAEADTLIL